ncbi:MAG: tetratricopeptide repeat protein [Mariniblastus sp.]
MNPVFKFGIRTLIIVFLLVSAEFSSRSTAVARQANGTAEFLEQKRTDDTTFLAGLRQRRLFEIAELYCNDQLSKGNLDPTSQATLVIELVKTQTAQAIFSPMATRPSVWQKALATSTDFLTTNPDHPRRYLVGVQSALSRISRAKLIAQEIAADMADANAQRQALDSLSKAQSQLRRLQQQITDAIPKQLNRKSAEHELTAAQLLTLNNNIRFQLAVCNLNRARLYAPTDRLNRVDALNGVKERLFEVQRETAKGDPLWWKTKLGLVECFRLMGKYQIAFDALAELPTKDIPIASANSLLEQKVLLAIAMQNAKFSQRIMSEVQKRESKSPQLDLAIVELAISQSRTAKTDKLKEQWVAFASSQAKRVEQTHGPYWARRANLALINSVSNSTNSIAGSGSPSTGEASLDLLIRIADEAMRKKQFDDALKAYDQAARKAASSGSNDLALQMDIRASQIFEQQKKPEQAAIRLIDSANRNTQTKLAAAAHHRGCWNYSRTIAIDKVPRTKKYQEYLEEHLATWPNQPSSDQVRIWLGMLLQNQKHWKLAIETYLQVNNMSPYLEPAIAQLKWCATTVLREQRAKGESTLTLTTELVKKLNEKQATLEQLDPAGMQIFLASVELDLIFGSKNVNPQLVESLSEIETSDDDSLAKLATAIHAVSIALEAPDQSKRLISQIADNEPALDLCDRCLSAVVTRSVNDSNKRLNEIRLVVIEKALLQPRDANRARTNWLMRKSQTLTRLHRNAEAVAVLEKLETEFPRNAGVKMELARALSAAFSESAPDKPLAKWRQIAGRVKSHSPNWFEAKYNVADLLLQQGKKSDAAKLLKYIKAIPPGWEESSWKPKFEALLQRAL